MSTLLGKPSYSGNDYAGHIFARVQQMTLQLHVLEIANVRVVTVSHLDCLKPT